MSNSAEMLPARQYRGSPKVPSVVANATRWTIFSSVSWLSASPGGNRPQRGRRTQFILPVS